MKVDPTRAARTEALKKSSKSRSDGAGFAQHLDGESVTTREAAALRPTNRIDPLIGLDTATDSPQKRARQRGEDMLSQLEELRMGLLLGSLPKSRLEALARLADEERTADLDPGLGDVLDQIELRARVELAKLEQD